MQQNKSSYSFVDIFYYSKFKMYNLRMAVYFMVRWSLKFHKISFPLFDVSRKVSLTLSIMLL